MESGAQKEKRNMEMHQFRASALHATCAQIYIVCFIFCFLICSNAFPSQITNSL